MATSDPAANPHLPLRDRMPLYLRRFAVGLGASTVFAAIVATVSSAGFLTGLGNTLLVIGVAMLLAGGMGGGGYAHLSAAAVASVRRKTSRHYTSFAETATTPTSLEPSNPQPPPPPVEPPDPAAPVRKRRNRYQPNPKAFWQVMAGFTYLALGALVIMQLAS